MARRTKRSLHPYQHVPARRGVAAYVGVSADAADDPAIVWPARPVVVPADAVTPLTAGADTVPGGEGGGALSVDNTVDPPVEVTTLIAPGATIAGEEATLSEGIVLATSVTLTDAQIKALPGTDVEIVAAVAAGQVIAVIGGLIYCDTTAGAYTNIDATAQLQIQYGDAGIALAPIKEPAAGVSDLLAAGSIRTALLGVYALTDGEAFPLIAGEIEEDGLEIGGSNGAAGSFTGGNAANSMIVTVFYTVVTLP